MVKIADVTGVEVVSQKSQVDKKGNSYKDILIDFNRSSANDVKELEAKSKIGDEKPTTASLKKLGFEKQPTVDANGGVYYTNKAGDVIRISGSTGQYLTGPEGSSCVSFTSADRKTIQEIVFDPYGEPMKGFLNITDDNGIIDSYSYEYDVNGNKSVCHSISTND